MSCLVDIFVSISDPRQSHKVKHQLSEVMAVAVIAVLVGADTFVEIQRWAELKLDWLRRYFPLEAGIPKHDTFGRLFAVIDPNEFEAAFQRWVSGLLPILGNEVVAIDGKTSRRSGKMGSTPLHLVSAFAAGAGLVLGQKATAEKSNEKTAIPELLKTLALQGCIVTIDAMGTQANIAKTILDQGADYVLAVKGNQPKLAESMRDFFEQFKAVSAEKTPHHFAETIDKDHGRLETRRCYAFTQLDCLHDPEKWPKLTSFVVIESERIIKGKTTQERRYYITSLQPDADRIGRAIRQHWAVENSLHWCMDVVFGDDDMRARTGNAAHNLAVVRHITLNILRLNRAELKGSLKTKRLIAATSDEYRAQFFGLA